MHVTNMKTVDLLGKEDSVFVTITYWMVMSDPRSTAHQGQVCPPAVAMHEPLYQSSSVLPSTANLDGPPVE